VEQRGVAVGEVRGAGQKGVAVGDVSGWSREAWLLGM
jgi:hypothetical protein